MSKFTGKSSAEEVAKGHDLSGKNVVITGGYAGIGRETARVFALIGANVYILGRDVSKANKAIEELKTETGKKNITFLECDLASLDSVRSFATKFNQLKVPVHYLILNAGVMAVPQGKTKDGFEIQFGTNHVGHFLLTNLLLPRLLEAAPARVVSVSSAGHGLSGIIWDDYNFDKHTYTAFAAYGQSKTANILFAIELNRRYKDKGITANSLHPGVIHATDLYRHVDMSLFTPEVMAKIPNVEKLMKFSQEPKSNQQGAATTIYAALSPDAQGGKFYDDCKESEPIAHASDPEEAKKLWDLTAKLVKL